jgi:hypothetical protein
VILNSFTHGENMTADLILHRGARPVSRDELLAVHTPARTRSWVPIAHSRLLEGVQAALERSALAVVNERHGLTKDGSRYFGLLEVRNGHNADDFGLLVGLRNSHDKSFPAGLVLGARIFVCDNLSFSGEVGIARKHTVFVERDLPQLVERAVGQLGCLRRAQEIRFTAYKHHELTDTQAHDLLIQALDARVVPVTHVPTVLKEWREPRHAEFREGPYAALLLRFDRMSLYIILSLLSTDLAKSTNSSLLCPGGGNLLSFSTLIRPRKTRYTGSLSFSSERSSTIRLLS